MENYPVHQDSQQGPWQKMAEEFQGSQQILSSNSEQVIERSSDDLLEEKAKRFIEARKTGMSDFAKNSYLKYQTSKTAQTFSFEATGKIITIPTRWFNGEYSDGELVFASYHELSHFSDMRKNPEAYLKNFDRLEDEATSSAKRYCAKYPGLFSEDIIKQYYYNELHDLYNSLDDIYVNQIVKYRAPRYADGYGRNEIISLYEKLNFGEADLTGLPKHQQIITALLRDAMVGDMLGQSAVSSDIAEILDKKVLGKSMRGRVMDELQPKPNVLLDPQERYRKIQTFIEPVYRRLLEEYMEEKAQEKSDRQNTQNQSEDPNNDSTKDVNNSENPSNFEIGDDGGDSQFDPFGSHEAPTLKKIFSSGDNDDVKKMLKDFAEEDKVKKMSPQDRNKYNARKAQEKFDQDHRISPESRAEFESVREEIADARREMQKFWSDLVGKAIEYKQKIAHEQMRGNLNIESIIRHYPELIEAESNGNFDKLPIYSRMELEKTLVDKPELIEVSLVVDGSESMSGKKIQIARKAATLLMLSLVDFNTELEYRKKETHSKLRTDTEVIMFGSDFNIVKRLDKENNYNTDMGEAEVVSSVSKMLSGYGGTYDNGPLEHILSTIDSERLEKIKNGKLKKIVFEITDGASSSEDETKRAIQGLIANGVLVFAFQIGDVDQWEKDIFNNIWNNNDSMIHNGISIGDGEIANLPEKLIQSLKDMVKNIQI